MMNAAVFVLLLIPLLINYLLATWAIVELRRRNLDDTTLALWVLIILIAPFIGLIAFLAMQPGKQFSSK
jgi:hypothetical protein